MKILIAEDENDILLGLTVQLESRGYEIIGAGDGEEALALIVRHDPDIVILDLMMPKKNGYEVIKELRKQPKWRPVIMLSALNDTKDVIKGYQHEADYYLTKPFKIDQLVEGIKVMTSLIPIRKQAGG